MKKRIALALALLMLGTSVLAGCKKGGTTSDEEINNTNKPVDLDAPVITVGAPEMETTEYDDIEMISVDGTTYSAAMFRTMLYQVADSVGGTDTQAWITGAVEALKEWKSLDTLSRSYSVYLEDSDYEEIYNLRTQTIAEYENPEAYYEELDFYHLTDTVYVENIKQNVLFTKFAEAFVAAFVPDEQAMVDYAEEKYIRVKHILVKTEGLDDSQKAEARSRADRVLERAKAGESFEALVQEISEDGMDPELGYYFTNNGKMVKAFEDASFALEVGQISDIVESQYGYHIIKKYPMEREHILADSTIVNEAASYLCNEAYEAAVAETVAKAQVEYLEKFDETVNTLIAEYQA